MVLAQRFRPLLTATSEYAATTRFVSFVFRPTDGLCPSLVRKDAGLLIVLAQSNRIPLTYSRRDVAEDKTDDYVTRLCTVCSVPITPVRSVSVTLNTSPGLKDM